MLDLCRAVQGLGPAAFLPSGVLLMANVYRPGPRKNLVFSLYGASAPLGFFFGVFIAGLTGQFLHFGWYFWIGAMLLFTTAIAAWLTVPSDVEAHKKMGIKMDWLGSSLIVSGLILVVFAITDSSGAPQGWRTPYIYTLLIVGVLLLAFAVYVEGWVASSPLLPFDLFSIPYIKPLFVALFFSYGVLGIFLLYATLYMQNIMGASPIQVSAWFVPMCVGGVLISVCGGYILHLLDGTILVLISALAWIVVSVLFAVAPVGASYWAYVFPSMICATIGIDIVFNVANIFITTNVSSRRQGLAGALINSLLYLGIAVLIGFADVVQTATKKKGLKESYQAVFWYQLACAGVAFVIMALFVRIRKAESDLTVDEKEALQREAAL
jgi:predicted MFS family arabinose efflux permease